MAKRHRSAASKRRSIITAIVIAALAAGVCILAVKRMAAENSGTVDTGRAAATQPISSELPQPDYGDLLYVTAPDTLEGLTKQYEGYRVSFNPSFHIPNWSAWELTKEKTYGEAGRTNKFESDPEVKGCPDTRNYSNTGYDRGHMAPAGDMKWSREAMRESFYLTNICPQNKALNSGAWGKLEKKCRDWAQTEGPLYIICGPVYSDGPEEYIGESKVYVPKGFFKVILAPYSDRPKGIGFIMPNGKVKGGMAACAVPIDSVEAVTGYDFFSTLPDSIEHELESQCNFNRWRIPSAD